MPSIKSLGGIDAYLDATRRAHGGWGAARFRKAAENNMPQEKMAEIMGVARATIGSWERLMGIKRYKKEQISG